MSKRPQNNRIEPQRISRRYFIHKGMTAASATGLGLAIQSRPAFAGKRKILDQPIDPGFLGPQSYNSREEEELIDVLEARAPFRHYPGNPPKTKTFEEECAKYTGSKYTLGVNSGTAALDCALTALEIGPGDEVIIPAFSWWSNYTCVLMAGALPVFAEMDRTIGLDPADFARKITPRTKAVIPVHSVGGHCDMDPIMEIARKKGIAVVEDAAQSVGGS